MLATVATIIASQAVISGAFSVTQQAIQLGFIPRLRITPHQRAGGRPDLHPGGQLGADDHGHPAGPDLPDPRRNLAAAYGIAVTGAMLIDTCLIAVVLFSAVEVEPRGWRSRCSAIFFIVDIAYFAANLTKVPDGGWFPLLVGAIAFTLLTTWAQGPQADDRADERGGLPIEIFIKSAATSATRVPGTAVFMTTVADGVPACAAAQPQAQQGAARAGDAADRAGSRTCPIVDEERAHRDRAISAHGFFRVILRYGFMEETDVPAALGAGRDVRRRSSR